MKTNIEAVIFDLGGTLIEYHALGLNWSSHYQRAFEHAAVALGIQLNQSQIQAALSTFEKYNTRLHPREIEYSSSHIFSEATASWFLGQCSPYEIARSFYRYFQQYAVAFSDAQYILPVLKSRGLAIGILTDLAIGMPNETVREDALALSCPVNCFLTSAEIGFRKPNQTGYRKVAEQLGVNLSRCMFVGDEQKDIVGANNCGMISVLINRTDTHARYGQTHTLNSLYELPSLL